MESFHPVEMPYHAGPFLDLAESVSRWSIGYVRQQGAEETHLLELARRLLNNLRETTATMERASAEAEEAVDGPDDGAGEALSVKDETALMERLNNVYLIVSTARASIQQLKGRFVRAVQTMDADLADDLKHELDKALVLAEEFEQFLILLGAGTDEDVASIMHLVPSPEELGYVA